MAELGNALVTMVPPRPAENALGRMGGGPDEAGQEAKGSGKVTEMWRKLCAVALIDLSWPLAGGLPHAQIAIQKEGTRNPVQGTVSR